MRIFFRNLGKNAHFYWLCAKMSFLRELGTWNLEQNTTAKSLRDQDFPDQDFPDQDFLNPSLRKSCGKAVEKLWKSCGYLEDI